MFSVFFMYTMNESKAPLCRMSQLPLRNILHLLRWSCMWYTQNWHFWNFYRRLPLTRSSFCFLKARLLCLSQLFARTVYPATCLRPDWLLATLVLLPQPLPRAPVCLYAPLFPLLSVQFCLVTFRLKHFFVFIYFS